jgi:hypothetical protein
LERSDNSIRLTKRGRLLSNEVFQHFLTPDPRSLTPALVTPSVYCNQRWLEKSAISQTIRSVGWQREARRIASVHAPSAILFLSPPDVTFSLCRAMF